MNILCFSSIVGLICHTVSEISLFLVLGEDVSHPHDAEFVTRLNQERQLEV